MILSSIILRKFGINRNIVECKYVGMMGETFKYVVLIETLWNVNSENKLFRFSSASVLIETLWNVNQDMENKKKEGTQKY